MTSIFCSTNLRAVCLPMPSVVPVINASFFLLFDDDDDDDDDDDEADIVAMSAFIFFFLKHLEAVFDDFFHNLRHVKFV